MNAMSQWFALQTEPRSEKKVERLLIQKGYECLLPLYQQRRRWADRSVVVETPLFPRYIFCRFDPQVLGKAVSTSGVSRVVGFGGRPAEVSPDEIKALQLLAQSPLLREPWAYIPDGTMVRVETGPLTGAEGIISLGADQQRLVISVTLLQRSIAVQLNEDTVVSVIETPRGNKVVRGDGATMALKLIKDVRR
jgi:transcription antitermination factor NusG